MENPINYIGNKVYAFVNNNLSFVITLAIIGIISAIVGHYGQLGFKWKPFIFFELPLYVFCGWALHKAYVIYRRAKDISN